jgi:hypothetical protein
MVKLIRPRRYLSGTASTAFAKKILEKAAPVSFDRQGDASLVYLFSPGSTQEDHEELFRLLLGLLDLLSKGTKRQTDTRRITQMAAYVRVALEQREMRGEDYLSRNLTQVYNRIANHINQNRELSTETLSAFYQQVYTIYRNAPAIKPPSLSFAQIRQQFVGSPKTMHSVGIVLNTMNQSILQQIRRNPSYQNLLQKDENSFSLFRQTVQHTMETHALKARTVQFLQQLDSGEKTVLQHFFERDYLPLSGQVGTSDFIKSGASGRNVEVFLTHGTQKELVSFFRQLDIYCRKQQETRRQELREKIALVPKVGKPAPFSFATVTEIENTIAFAQQQGYDSFVEIQMMKEALRLYRYREAEAQQLQTNLSDFSKAFVAAVSEAVTRHHDFARHFLERIQEDRELSVKYSQYLIDQITDPGQVGLQASLRTYFAAHGQTRLAELLSLLEQEKRATPKEKGALQQRIHRSLETLLHQPYSGTVSTKALFTRLVQQEQTASLRPVTQLLLQYAQSPESTRYRMAQSVRSLELPAKMALSETVVSYVQNHPAPQTLNASFLTLAKELEEICFQQSSYGATESGEQVHSAFARFFRTDNNISDFSEVYERFFHLPVDAPASQTTLEFVHALPAEELETVARLTTLLATKYPTFQPLDARLQGFLRENRVQLHRYLRTEDNRTVFHHSTYQEALETVWKHPEQVLYHQAAYETTRNFLSRKIEATQGLGQEIFSTAISEKILSLVGSSPLTVSQLWEGMEGSEELTLLRQYFSENGKTEELESVLQSFFTEITTQRAHGTVWNTKALAERFRNRLQTTSLFSALHQAAFLHREGLERFYQSWTNRIADAISLQTTESLEEHKAKLEELDQTFWVQHLSQTMERFFVEHSFSFNRKDIQTVSELFGKAVTNRTEGMTARSAQELAFGLVETLTQEEENTIDPMSLVAEAVYRRICSNNVLLSEVQQYATATAREAEYESLTEKLIFGLSRNFKPDTTLSRRAQLEHTTEQTLLDSPLYLSFVENMIHGTYQSTWLGQGTEHLLQNVYQRTAEHLAARSSFFSSQTETVQTLLSRLEGVSVETQKFHRTDSATDSTIVTEHTGMSMPAERTQEREPLSVANAFSQETTLSFVTQNSTAPPQKREETTLQLETIRNRMEHLSGELEQLRKNQQQQNREFLRKSDAIAMEEQFTRTLERDIYLAGKRHGIY